jgi:hypothetical protein
MRFVSAIPPDLTRREQELLARLLADAALPRQPVARKIRGLRKVSEHVERTAVSAGCHGEVVQWRLKARPE